MAENKEGTFYLGLTMAGAVSAGCYSAGVMDYLFEILDLWERAKKGEVAGIDPALVPTHKVVIDAMGGASAGGMATMMSCLYALEGDIKPVKEIPKDPRASYNILYDSWVHLDDDQEKLTFEKVWDTDDLEGKNAKLTSLLNTKVIDNIAERAFMLKNGNTLKEQVEKLPSYISRDLEILISHTLLRGIPLEVDFSTGITPIRDFSPRHTSFEHFMVSHFKLHEGDPVNEKEYLWLNPYEKSHAARMKLSTIATGAFPLGLKFREFRQEHFNDDYIRSAVKRTVFGEFGKDNPDPENKLLLGGIPPNFESVSVDGGAVNNEPYGEIASILRHRHPKATPQEINYGVVMIDPFPDGRIDPNDYKKQEDLAGAVPGIIQALWNQAKVKRRETISHLSDPYLKGQIYPVRHYSDNGKWTGVDPDPIACASFQAFGGFLDINFRVHDFFLGRNNSRNFFRYYFSLPYDPENGIVHPIHQTAFWSEASIEKYKIIGSGGKIFLPIIPDLNIVLDNLPDTEAEKFKYTVNERPKYDPKALFQLDKKMTVRYTKILTMLKDRLSTSPAVQDDKEDPKLSDRWMNTRYFQNPFKKAIAKIIKIGIDFFFKRTRRMLAKKVTESTIRLILKDLDEKRLLRKMDKK